MPNPEHLKIIVTTIKTIFRPKPKFKDKKHNPCHICFTPLSKDEVKQNKNVCSDCKYNFELDRAIGS
jgi:acetyl-CoA carboxylase beta subunit